MKDTYNDTLILSIESSCDDTCAAITKNGNIVLSNIISSQIKFHKLYGGIVPEIASRKHMEVINYVIKEALQKANITFNDLNAIAVTYGPGLIGSLLVGISEAKAISFAKNIPLIGINHLEGHIASIYIEYPNLIPPFICLIVSGGHTEIIMVNNYNNYKIIGTTIDDAAGEVFDKIARIIGLDYPGGPKIDNIAKNGNDLAINFPQQKLYNSQYNFSFSWLKSFIFNYIKILKLNNSKIIIKDIAASFQNCIINMLSNHSIKAVLDYKINKLSITGGVACNSRLREVMREQCNKNKIKFYIPSPIFCTDNAAMIGMAAYFKYKNRIYNKLDLNVNPYLKLV